MRLRLKTWGIPSNNIDIIVAQAKHETANFKSAVFRRNNNAFGMRPAYVRRKEQMGDTDSDGYANYSSIEQSVDDLLLWFQYNGITLKSIYYSPESYARVLKLHKYFEADLNEYSKGVARWM